MVGGARKRGILPWGWWLRANGEKLEDEQGRTWRSVKEAWWVGERGFPSVHYAQEQHELLLRVLLALEVRGHSRTESNHDLFEGQMAWWRFYMCWLASIDLLDMTPGLHGRADPLHAGLSDEGREVLLMLQATRTPEFQDLPFAAVLDAVDAAARGPADEARERALRNFEADSSRRLHVFAREKVGRSHLVTLTGISAGPGARMPLRRVMWSQAFGDEVTRDDLFAWIVARVDRWDEWADLAYRRGAETLTRHVLTLYVASGRTA